MKRIWIIITIFSRLVLQNLVLEIESTFPLVFALCCFTVNFQKAHKMEMWPHSECFTQWKAQGHLRLRAHLFHVWGQQFNRTSDGCRITTETRTHTVIFICWLVLPALIAPLVILTSVYVNYSAAQGPECSSPRSLLCGAHWGVYQSVASKWPVIVVPLSDVLRFREIVYFY